MKVGAVTHIKPAVKPIYQEITKKTTVFPPYEAQPGWATWCLWSPASFSSWKMLFCRRRWAACCYGWPVCIVFCCFHVPESWPGGPDGFGWVQDRGLDSKSCPTWWWPTGKTMSNGPSMNKYKCCKGYRAKCIQNTLREILVFKTTIQKFFYLEINTFIQQGCIQVDQKWQDI